MEPLEMKMNIRCNVTEQYMHYIYLNLKCSHKANSKSTQTPNCHEGPEHRISKFGVVPYRRDLIIHEYEGEEEDATICIIVVRQEPDLLVYVWKHLFCFDGVHRKGQRPKNPKNCANY